MLDSFTREEVAEERKRLHCVNCKRLTIHNLEASCVGRWSTDDGYVNGGDKYSIFRCGACDNICYETQSWDSESVDYDQDGDQFLIEVSTQYPAPVSAHFNFNTASTPHGLNLILDEMLYALAGSKMLTATISLRMAVEYVVNDKECQGKTLVSKINDLKIKQLIDDEEKDLLHRIRQRGNASAHSSKRMNAKELIAGMSIIEGLLEKLYNGPARHAETIKKANLLIKPD